MPVSPGSPCWSPWAIQTTSVGYGFTGRKQSFGLCRLVWLPFLAASSSGSCISSWNSCYLHQALTFQDIGGQSATGTWSEFSQWPAPAAKPVVCRCWLRDGMAGAYMTKLSYPMALSDRSSPGLCQRIEGNCVWVRCDALCCYDTYESSSGPNGQLLDGNHQRQLTKQSSMPRYTESMYLRRTDYGVLARKFELWTFPSFVQPIAVWAQNSSLTWILTSFNFDCSLLDRFYG